MAEGGSEDVKFGWTCKECFTWNLSQVHECSTCQTKKPYEIKAVYSPVDDPFEEDHNHRAEEVSGQASSSRDRPDRYSRHLSAEHGNRWKFPDNIDEEVLEFPYKECRMVLLGKTGSGKSSTGNTILGSQKFEVGRGSRSMTGQSWWMYANRFGIKLEIVDTPGLFDTALDDVTVTKEIVKSVGCTSPGPHAILFVVRADTRFTAEEAAAVTAIRRLFGNGIMRYIVIIFTHGDQFDSYGDFCDEYLADPEAALGNLLQETKRRFVLFNNLEKDPKACQNQVKQLMLAIRNLLSDAGNKPFENPMLVRCQEIMVANTEELMKNLEGGLPEDSGDSLIRAALMGKKNAETLIHEILDCRSTEAVHLKKENERLRNTLEKEYTCSNEVIDSLEKVLEQVELTKTEVETEHEGSKEDVDTLKKALKQAELAKIEIEEELLKEKKKWKCVFL